MAEYTILVILLGLRRVHQMDRALNNGGEWRDAAPDTPRLHGRQGSSDRSWRRPKNAPRTLFDLIGPRGMEPIFQSFNSQRPILDERGGKMPGNNATLDQSARFEHRGRRPTVGRPRVRTKEEIADQTASRFVDWLREQLQDRDWPDRELAERIGVSPAAVSRWMSGSRTPSPGNVNGLAQALSVDVGEIIARLAGDNALNAPVSRPTGPKPTGIASIVGMNPDDIPEWLRHELARQDLSPDELAREVGVEATVVRFWLLGLLTPAPYQLSNLAVALNRGRALRPAV